MKRLLCLVPLLVAACVEEMQQVETEDMTIGEVEVLLDVSGGGFVKSSLSPDECLIADLSLCVYRNGVQVYHEYHTSAERTLKLKLVHGQTYNFYVVANAGSLPAFTSEEDFQKNFAYSISSITDLKDRIPMAWSATGVKVHYGMDAIDVELERLAAKIVFSLDKSLLEGLTVTSVNLCQCASVVRPFKYPDGAGSRAENVREVIAGDRATSYDLDKLNGGGNICFYTLENCQGILLPDNGLSSDKLPEAIGDRSKLCTYIEVAGRFTDEGYLDGDVTYRFYLGLDACSSFDVPGNACIDVHLQLTDSGLREVSWRVDADVSVRDGYAWGAVQEGAHGMNDLYVGEKALYRVEFSDEMLSYVGDDVQGCSLWLDADVEGVQFTPLTGHGKVYTSEVSCTAACTGRLYLCSPDGQKLAMLCSNVNVNLPHVVVSECATVADDEPVEALAYPSECVINGASKQLYVYLTDRRKMNLNSSSAYGFDLDLFDFSLTGLDGHAHLDEAFSAMFARGRECSGGYAALMRLNCRHDGNDPALAEGLAAAYSDGDMLRAVVADGVNGASGIFDIVLDIHPVELKLVDNGWAGYHSTQLSMKVSNGSRMPLQIIVCQMIDNNHAWSSSMLTSEVKQHVEQGLVRKDINYITGSVNAYDQVMHVAASQVECTGSGVFPLEGIRTDNLMSSLIYDGYGNDSMYHLVDVSTAGRRIHGKDISFVDALSDGSSLYDDMYYSDWDSKGVWLFSNDVPVQSAGNYLIHFPNLSPKRILRMKQRYDSCPSLGLQMWYDGKDFRGYVSNSQGVAYDLTMTVRFYGQVLGYVQTDPNGIWGSVKDNYCTASFDKTLTGVRLADFLANVSMDGGTVKQAMDAIYAQTFEDKSDGKKFPHSAHPVSMDCNVEISVEGEKGQELYPMHIWWEYPYVVYYHAQDNMSYSCRMTVSTPRFNMILVDEK